MRILAALATILAMSSLTPHAQESKSDLLLITIDTLRADRVGAYGYSAAETPQLNRLAAEGVLFENAFTHSPVTLSAHAALLTGRLPFQHGVRSNSLYRLPKEEKTLAEILGSAGYQTAAFVSAAALDHDFALNQGFSVYDDELNSLEEGQLIAERSASATASRAIGWLQKIADSPFFLWVHFFDPHHPYAPPEPFRSRFQASPYDGEIAYSDREIGRVLDELARIGRRQRTLVVVAADHGEGLGEHGEETHGVFVYDSTLRVPLIMAGPGVPRGARDERGPVGLVDVLPTLLGRLGVAPQGSLSGRDLFEDGPADFLYAETYLTRDFYNWSPLHALRTERYKFIEAPRPELYDLRSDPGERRNVVAERANTARQLASRLGGALARSGTAESSHEPGETLLARLHSLGYLGARARPGGSPDRTLPDPKDRIGVVAEIDEVIALLGSRRYRDAETKIRQILKTDPGNFLATNYLADVLFEQRRNEEAIHAYHQAMEKGRETAYYRFRLGILNELLGRYEQAAEEFGRAVDRSPKAALEVLKRAKELLDDKAVDGALAYLETLKGRGSRGAALASALAEAWMLEGDASRALQAVEDGLLDAENDSVLLAARGSVLQQLGRPAEALASYEKALPRLSDPKDKARALKATAALHGEQGALERAAQYFEQAAAIDPGDFEARANWALSLARAGKGRAALEPLGKALELRPKEVRIINLKAEIHFQLSELELSRGLLRRSLALQPDQPRIVEALAEVEKKIQAAEKER